MRWPFALSVFLFLSWRQSKLLVFADSAVKNDGFSGDGSRSSSAVEELSSYDMFQSKVLQSDSIWMIQFRDPVIHKKKFPAMEMVYKELGRIVKGLFHLGVVDVSTDVGRRIASQYPQQTTSTGPVVILLGDNKKVPLQILTDNSVVDFQILLESLAKAGSDLISERIGPKGQQQEKRKPNDGSRKTSYITVSGSADFETKVLQNPNVVLVAFTAPWCGHCQRLEPEFRKAAKRLANDNVSLVWINAEEDRALAALYSVKGFPTIKLFPGGAPKTHSQAMDFPYERTEPSIVTAVLREVDRTGVPPEIPELTSPAILEKECQGANRICVLAALPHIVDSGAETRNKYRTLLAQVAKSFRGTGAYSFLWFQGGGAQPGLEKAFDLTFGFPALVAFSMDRQAFAVLRASFTDKKIAAFLHGVTNGREPTVKLEQLPKVETVEPWDGKDAIPITQELIAEEEFDLSEIMGDGDEL